MMIAARNSFLMSGGSSTPTARDYVQDGLVAMWDGIENAGWGQHSDSPILRELVSGDTLTATGAFSVAENGLATSGGSSFEGSATSIDLYNNLLGNVTLEFLFTPTSFGGGRMTHISYSPDLSHRYFLTYGTYTSGVTYLDNGFQVRATSWNSTGAVYRNVRFSSGDANHVFRLVGGVASGRVYRTWYRDGTQIDSGSNTAGTLTGTPPLSYTIFMADGTIGVVWHCARLYNRALSASELAANYAVDAARFGL